MQIRESGAAEVEEIVAVTMGPASAVRALHKAVSLGADRSVHLSDDALTGSDVAATGYALARTLERESPDLVLLGQQSDDGECYTIGAVVADHLQMPSLTQVIAMELNDSTLRCERQAEYGYDTVEVDAARRDLGRRRDQRAALPVAQGDHGGQEEAARHRRRSATSASRPTASAIDGSRVICGDFAAPPQKAAGTIIEDEDTAATVEQIVAWLDERKLI